MPLKAFKCIVDLTIHMVSTPGVRLANKDDLYLNVCLLGQQRRTRLVPPLFPLIFDDHLVFSKTFNFCRDPSDVVNLLSGSHVFIELIHLGRSENCDVLASYETTSKDFLYPYPEFKIIYHTAQRDLFMTSSDEFPGAIQPQLQFCTSTRIEETRTPSFDILQEHEQRFIYDPLIDIKKSKPKMKRSGAKSAKSIPRGYRTHTISSAIKADYGKQDVREKLSELNSTVESRVEDVTSKPVINEKVSKRRTKGPFVVGKVPTKLIGRSPGSHKILNDGLIFVRKSRDRKRSKSSTGHKSTSRNRSLNRTHSLNRSTSLSRTRSARSHSPSLNKERAESVPKTENTENADNATKIENAVTTENAKTEPETQEAANNTSKLLNSSKKEITLDNCDLCSNTHHKCEICADYRYRTGKSFRGNRYHRGETKSNPSAVFEKKSLLAEKSALELMREERYLNSSDYLRRSYNLLKDKYARDRYPLNQSFAYYTPPSSRYDWKYSRLYPWYFTYTDYLRELEDELYWLKVRSKMLNY